MYPKALDAALRKRPGTLTYEDQEMTIMTPLGEALAAHEAARREVERR